MATRDVTSAIPAQRGVPPAAPEPPPAEAGAAAALVAAGVGCLTLGLGFVIGAASVTVEELLNWYDAVGPLSGKTTLATLVYVVAWPLLHVRMRRRPMPPERVLTVSFTLLALGLLGTFPPFYMLFYQALP